jgi:hypothetical protein
MKNKAEKEQEWYEELRKAEEIPMKFALKLFGGVVIAVIAVSTIANYFAPV